MLKKGCIIEELNEQEDHVHVVLLISPKVSISDMVWILEGRTAIRLFNKY
ncbi:MAG: transposase [Mangrovibacterium sp.]